MKFWTFFLLMLLFNARLLSAQETEVHVYIASGGAYGNPSDHVMVRILDTETLTLSDIGEVWTESVQDLIVTPESIVVAAQDSVVSFDKNTHQRTSAIEMSNLNRLFHHGDHVFVARQTGTNGPPPDGIFLKALNTDDLSLAANVSGIDADAAGMIVHDNKLYVAVPGDWQSSTGKMAIVDLNTLTLEDEVDFGAEGIGISDLFIYQDKIYSVNKSPYGITTGYVAKYDPAVSDWETTLINHTTGRGYGIKGNLLFLGLDFGIGSFDLNNMQVFENEIVPDPGSLIYVFINSAVVDTVNNHVFVNISDYYSVSEGSRYDFSGSQTGTYDPGISCEAAAIDYVTQTSLINENSMEITVFPNPASDVINISLPEHWQKTEAVLFNATGKQVLILTNNLHRIDMGHLPKGIYYLRFKTGNRTVVKKIVII